MVCITIPPPTSHPRPGTTGSQTSRTPTIFATVIYMQGFHIEIPIKSKSQMSVKSPSDCPAAWVDDSRTFSTSRESILPIWSSTAQLRRSQPDTHAPELFVLLHGMLFTNIQLDDFSLTLSFRLALELSSSMLSFVLRNPMRKASPFARSTLNPYLSVMLTFLATVTKHTEIKSVGI
ncbi:hypothetical protein BDR03DRAFT_1013462 [Suillus americanus]|nr:hypothetical protein BDR03DRAFT_1013462 [Suillus americanus]